MTSEEEALVDEVLESVAKDRALRSRSKDDPVFTRRKHWAKRLSNVARRPVVYEK